jgi:hypothetical protein
MKFFLKLSRLFYLFYETVHPSAHPIILRVRVVQYYYRPIASNMPYVSLLQVVPLMAWTMVVGRSKLKSTLSCQSKRISSYMALTTTENKNLETDG